MLDDLLELVLDVGGELLFSRKKGVAGQARRASRLSRTAAGGSRSPLFSLERTRGSTR